MSVNIATDETRMNTDAEKILNRRKRRERRGQTTQTQRHGGQSGLKPRRETERDANSANWHELLTEVLENFWAAIGAWLGEWGVGGCVIHKSNDEAVQFVNQHS